MSNFDLNNDNLSDVQREQLANLLYSHKDIFMTQENTGMGYTDIVQHHIHI